MKDENREQITYVHPELQDLLDEMEILERLDGRWLMDDIFKN